MHVMCDYYCLLLRRFTFYAKNKLYLRYIMIKLPTYTDISVLFAQQPLHDDMSFIIYSS